MDMLDSVSLEVSQASFAAGRPAPSGAIPHQLVKLAPVRADELPRQSDQSHLRPSKERLRLQLYLVLLFIDLSSIVGGFSAANLLRFGDLHHGPGLSLALGCIPIFVMLAFSGSCYSIDVLTSPGLGIRRALRALALTVMGLLIALFSVKTAGGVSRIVFALGLATTSSMIGLLRFLFGRSCGRKHQWNFRNEVLLVDGVNILPTQGQIVVFADSLGFSPTSNNPNQFAQLGRLLANCDSVMLATKPDRRALWVATLKGCGIAVEVLAPELDGLGALRFRNTEGGSALLVSVGPLGLRQKLLKRSLDLSISIPFLVIAAPLMLGISAAIKLTSRGPVLFRQPRVGQSNRLFHVMKFRTMRADVADQAGTRSTSRDDDRVTSVGRLLRKTSLDELPQLFNVISGNMSLVGPRPHALESKAGQRLFWDADSRYWQRGAVRPGITGLAQVRGFRGATDKEEDLVNRVQSDLDYLLEWSIWKDVKIIIQTVRVLIHPKAY